MKQITRFLLIVLSVVIVGVVMAQTRVKTSMLLGPIADTGRVLMLSPTGAIIFAQIGSNITLIDGVLQVTIPARTIGEKPIRQEDGSYQIQAKPKSGILIVYRNGVRQALTDDYTFDGNQIITPNATYPWDSSDLILADYE